MLKAGLAIHHIIFKGNDNLYKYVDVIDNGDILFTPALPRLYSDKNASYDRKLITLRKSRGVLL